jgi:two-component system, OmpR family, sensor histidine kinase QseC
VSLRRRLLLYVLLCAPLVWAGGLVVSVDRARHEVNELFDTEMIRLARQVQVTVGLGAPGAPAPPSPLPEVGSREGGEADVRDLAIAVWDSAGRQVLADREGGQLPRRADGSGFVDQVIDGEPWRVYYLQPIAGEWLVAAGQKVNEREEMVFGLTASHIVPWLLVLPVLLLAITWAVRRALAPLDQLAADVRGREADDLRPLRQPDSPAELAPLVGAMNALFARIGQTLARERRFTADAAHELRTPLAVLRAQWDVVRLARDPVERAQAEAKLGAGIDRMERLVTQMLALSSVESADGLRHATEVGWPAVVEQAMSDCLALAERRRMELACEWPPAGRHAMPLLGDAQLMTVLLRNLLDNALRYAPPGTTVTLRFGEDRIDVENEGASLTPARQAELGERFHRPEGQAESGSGLGISIARRIAALHALELVFGACDDGAGVRATVRFAAPPARAGTSGRVPSRAARALLRVVPRRRSAGPVSKVP